MTRGTTAEEFNLLSNSDFNDGATGWKKTGFVDTDDLIGSYCEIVGDYRTKKMLSQTVDVDDAADTVYVFGAMVTSDCLPNKDNGDGTDTSVAITLELDYGNGEKDYKTVFCEPKTGTNLVNLFGSVKTPYNVDKLTIYLKNLYNYGVAKFDDVYIFRDSAGIYYNYDNNGNLNYKQSESGAASNAVYDENGDIISSTDKRNLTTLYEYDSNRNLISTESPTGIFSINDYDSYGNVTSSRLSKMGKTLESGSSTYDTNGMYVTQTTDEFGHATDYTVNPDTLKTQEVKYGKPSASSDRFNYRVKYNYYENPKVGGGSMDGAGPVSSIYAYYEGNYESAAGVSFEYNKGEISKIKRGGYNYEFTKEYGAGTEYVNEGMTGLPYNFRSTTRINNSLDIGKTLYDAGGNLTATVYGNTNYHTYDRDVLGRITVKNTLRDKLSYTYNSKGLLAGVNSEYNNTSQMYSYDFAGRMSVSEFYDYSNDVSQKHKYTYDSSDMLTGVKSVFSKEDGQRDIRYTTYEYDREGRISEQDVYREGSGSIYLVPKMRYNYNDVGLLTSTVYSGANQVNLDTPITRGITYKTIEGNPNRLSSLIDTFDGYSYTYDNVGNIKSVDGPRINSATYIYDEANQLVKASGYYDTEQFEYDYNGNITKYHNVYYEQGYTNEYEYTYNYDSTWKDRLSSITSDSGRTVRAYTYGDQYSAGSTLPTSDGRFNFEWDGRMLTRATRISDNTAIDYKYDENGQRIEKKVTSGDGIVQKLTKYYYTDGALTTEVNYVPNNGTMIAETKVDYIYDNTGLAFVMVELYNNYNYYVSTGKYTFYAKRNAQGDVTSLVDITNGYMGDSIQYTYSAYGRRYIEGVSGDLCDMISKLNTLTFKSYSYDSDLGMYYLGSRWYDPEVCRFINGDNVLAGISGSVHGYNLFAYCFNNPVNMSDPDGNWPQKGGVVSTIDKLITKISNNITNTLNKLPTDGIPGSSQTLPNQDGTPKQKRWYGPDGKAERDRDYNHPGNYEFPHDHEWKDGERGKDHLPPSPDYEFSLKPVIGMGIITICAIATAAILVDDLSGVGVADDAFLPFLGSAMNKGIIMIFN